MDAESRITVQAYRGDIERTTGIAAIVSKIRPNKKSKKAKIRKGKKGGNKSIMNIGIEINSQATAPTRQSVAATMKDAVQPNRAAIRGVREAVIAPAV